MAKSRSFYSLRTGSTKSMTFSILRGAQITKDRVLGGTNPRTIPQMVQRMLFANAVKFYKSLPDGLSQFAFEDKKTKESDYNAFMRHNAHNSVSVAYEDYVNSDYPSIGAFQLTEGSLPVLTPEFTNMGVLLQLKLNHSSTDNSVAEFSRQLMAQYPLIMEGDVITFVRYMTNLKSDGTLDDTGRVDCFITQLVVDTSDQRFLSDVAKISGLNYTDHYSYGNRGGGAMPIQCAHSACIIVSRNTPSGLKVSTSRLIPNVHMQALMDSANLPLVIRANASSWGATDPAILQGSLAE